MVSKQVSPQIEAAKRYTAKVSDYTKVFSSIQGQKVLDDMFRAHGMLSSTFRGNADEGIYMEGQRAVVLRILQILNNKPEKLRAMIKSIDSEG